MYVAGVLSILFLLNGIRKYNLVQSRSKRYEVKLVKQGGDRKGGRKGAQQGRTNPSTPVAWRTSLSVISDPLEEASSHVQPEDDLECYDLEEATGTEYTDGISAEAASRKSRKSGGGARILDVEAWKSVAPPAPAPRDRADSFGKGNGIWVGSGGGGGGAEAGPAWDAVATGDGSGSYFFAADRSKRRGLDLRPRQDGVQGRNNTQAQAELEKERRNSRELVDHSWGLSLPGTGALGRRVPGRPRIVQPGGSDVSPGKKVLSGSRRNALREALGDDAPSGSGSLPSLPDSDDGGGATTSTAGEKLFLFK